MRKRLEERIRPERPDKREAIGAFCTDIADSTARIEKFGELALKHHKKYLEAAGRYFIKTNTESTHENHDLDDLWVPGDGLWGVCFGNSGSDRDDRGVTEALWRTLTSFAYGLSEANRDIPEILEPLKVKGVFLVGSVMREALFDEKLRLYNGTALNACGRLEKQVKPNTFVAGFVVPNNGNTGPCLVETVARAPVIYANGPRGIDQYLRRCFEPSGMGCKIHLDVVLKENRRMLRFMGWRKRRDLRGLGDCQVLTTRFRLELTPDCQLEPVYHETGDWNRSEGVILLAPTGASQWDLLDLLGAHEGPFEFTRHLYNRGELIVSLSSDGKSFVLQSHRKRDRPRIMKNQGTHRVDFDDHASCLLPTNVHSDSGGKNVLIQAYRKRGVRTLCFSLADDDSLSSYEDYADFLDSGMPAREIVFQET
jgi:hypothetical protein